VENWRETKFLFKAVKIMTADLFGAILFGADDHDVPVSKVIVKILYHDSNL